MLWRFVISLGTALALPVLGHAQPVAPDPLSVVEEHLRRGVELRRTGHDDEALREFEEAHRLAPSPRTGAQLGLVLQALGRWLDADRRLREALASHDDPWVARNREALVGALAALSRHLGALEVRGNVPGAEVCIAGAVVATLPMREPVRTLTGAVELEVRAPGYAAVTRRTVIDPDSMTRESVELRPLDAPRTEAPASTPATPPSTTPPLYTTRAVTASSTDGRASLRPWAIASFAGAGVALTVGLVGVVVREDAAVRFNTNCPPSPYSGGPLCDDLKDATALWGPVGVVALSVAGALTAAGTVLTLLPGRGARGATTWRCAPTGAGAVCGVTF